VVPVMRWIGPFFADFEGILKRGIMPLNEKDEMKAYSLMAKPYFQFEKGKSIHSDKISTT
jgi:hypothetical protein